MLPWPADRKQIIVKLQHCCNVSGFCFVILVFETSFSFQSNWEHDPPKDRALLGLYKVFAWG